MYIEGHTHRYAHVCIHMYTYMYCIHRYIPAFQLYYCRFAFRASCLQGPPPPNIWPVFQSPQSVAPTNVKALTASSCQYLESRKQSGGSVHSRIPSQTPPSNLKGRVSRKNVICIGEAPRANRKLLARIAGRLQNSRRGLWARRSPAKHTRAEKGPWIVQELQNRKSTVAAS